MSGSRSTFFVVASGCVWSWGENEVGQLGLGNLSILRDHADAGATGEHVHLAGGGRRELHAVPYRGGDVLAVGDGERAAGHPHRRHCGGGVRPKKVRGFAGRRVTCVSAGRETSAAVDEAGGLWTWGDRNLGHGPDEPMQKNKPAQIKSLKSQRMCLVSVGGMHMLATTHSGKLYAWGRGYEGALGLGQRVYVTRRLT